MTAAPVEPWNLTISEPEPAPESPPFDHAATLDADPSTLRSGQPE